MDSFFLPSGRQINLRLISKIRPVLHTFARPFKQVFWLLCRMRWVSVADLTGISTWANSVQNVEVE
jgi:hypothetical protein